MGEFNLGWLIAPILLLFWLWYALIFFFGPRGGGPHA